jgi:dethiobiotin synthetase/adenosylmethionine--8-amino-7-oxononanoate aminotransferase
MRYVQYYSIIIIYINGLFVILFIKVASNSFGDFWNESIAREISSLKNVSRVVSMGTLCAVELKSDSSGYDSGVAADIITTLMEDGINIRPLGNVIYVMCSLNSEKSNCDKVLQTIKLRLSCDGK